MPDRHGQFVHYVDNCFLYIFTVSTFCSQFPFAMCCKLFLFLRFGLNADIREMVMGNSND
jgi:hypothetical protein